MEGEAAVDFLLPNARHDINLDTSSFDFSQGTPKDAGQKDELKLFDDSANNNLRRGLTYAPDMNKKNTMKVT